MPAPRLLILTPCGAKAGSTVEVTFTGTDVEEPQALLFSHAGIKAEPVVPPGPPADPKKPKPPPPPITKFKVTVAANTPPGIHDCRFVNKWGVSNPRAFVVGDLPEVAEKEPNDDVKDAQRVELNTTINGVVVSPTDVDYFVFAGKKSQRVVASCLASSLDSRLTPALEMYDGDNRQVAYNRNYQGNDALVDYTLPKDGDYYVRLYQFTHAFGSAEFFYRLSITTAPWIDAIYPPVVEPGKQAKLTVYGRNLPGGQLDPTAVVDHRVLEKITVAVDAPKDPAALQRLTYSGHVPPHMAAMDGFEYRLRNGVGQSNPFFLTFARAPVVLDNEANDKPEMAQQVPVPCEIAGRIEKKKDRDWYSFTAKKNDVYNIEVFSDRLGSPTDMYLVLRNPATKQDIVELDENGDILSPIKFLSRTDDPPVYRFVAPADGTYQLLVASRLADTQAGANHLYQVRIAREQPDFRVVIVPQDNFNPAGNVLGQGGQQFLDVFAWRLDGFNGDITLTAEGLPKGVTCPPQIMGTGLRHATLVLSAAANTPITTAEFRVKATATINGKAVVREVRPASITWPVPPGQNIPAMSRLDRQLVLAVRDKPPYNLTATIDKLNILQGDKANLTLKVDRLWPDFKQPLTVITVNQPPFSNTLPANLVINNNQPVTLNPGKDTLPAPVIVNANVTPGTYTLVLRGQAQIPYNKDPTAPANQRPPIGVELPSTPLTITVLPKQVATVTLANANLTAKVGASAELVVRVARMFDYAGEFKVQVVLPANVKGISVADGVIPAGKDEVKLVVKAAADAAPGNRTDLIVRATATLKGNIAVTQEVKFNVNIVK